jgi:hypothetical protein
MASVYKTPGNQVYCDTRIRFRVVTWDDLRTDDVVFYHICRERYISQDERSSCHGPFTVVDRQSRKLRNPQGVVLPIRGDNIALLVMDLEELDRQCIVTGDTISKFKQTEATQ